MEANSLMLYFDAKSRFKKVNFVWGYFCFHRDDSYSI